MTWWKKAGVDLLDLIGFDLKLIVAGLCGGFLHAFWFSRNISIGVVIVSVLGGAFTANYAAVPLAKLTSLPVGLAGFLGGMFAMAFCQSLGRFIRDKIGLRNGNNDATGESS
jgi:hypothetical protein